MFREDVGQQIVSREPAPQRDCRQLDSVSWVASRCKQMGRVPASESGSQSRPPSLPPHCAVAGWGARTDARNMAPNSGATRSAWRGGGRAGRDTMVALCIFRTRRASNRAPGKRTTVPYFPWLLSQSACTSNPKRELPNLPAEMPTSNSQTDKKAHASQLGARALWSSWECD